MTASQKSIPQIVQTENYYTENLNTARLAKKDDILTINLADDRNAKYLNAVELAKKNGLHIIDVAGDGACLYRAVSVYTKGDESKHLALRTDAIKYMHANVTYYKGITSCDPDENLPFDK